MASFDMFPDSAIRYLIDNQENEMPQHEEPYKRDTKSKGSLSSSCGHHCGVLTVGHATQHEAHCSCPECHNVTSAVTEIDPVLMPGMKAGEGVDSRDIV